jgi:hypothetical protein
LWRVEPAVAIPEELEDNATGSPMNRTTLTHIIAVVFGMLVLYGLRDVLPGILTMVIGLLPFVLLSVAFYRRQRADYNPTASLVDRLQSQFERNQALRLEQTLSQLPEWQIATQIKATAHELLTLKRSIYRAQAEGVPTSLIQRYLGNVSQAADTLWQLASKIDAIGQNDVTYSVVQAQLRQEELRLQQLQQSIRETHEGIAVVIAAGIQSDTLRTVEEDLSALSQAIKFLQSTKA